MDEPDPNRASDNTQPSMNHDPEVLPDSTNGLPEHVEPESETSQNNSNLNHHSPVSPYVNQNDINEESEQPSSTNPCIETNENQTPEANAGGFPVIVLDSDEDDDIYANPEPPRELVEGQLMNADTIGDTVFSKHWLFTTLMNLIRTVDKESESKESCATPECGIDLEDSLQDDLCKLWDMSMNPEVVTFLMEFKAVELLTGVIAKSKAPRAVEICVGILGNMACQKTARSVISSSDKLRALLLLLLENPDAPTLVETTRLLYTCVSSASVRDLWMKSVKATPTVYDSLVFILQSSTNTDLLSHTADFMDKVMDSDDELLVQWSTVVAVQGILEAVKQCGSCKEAVDTYLHILQLVSTCEPGVEALGEHALPVCQLTLQYLIQLCSQELIVLEGQENTVGSALSVLATAFTALEDKAPFLVQDFQLMRCLLKILHVVYPKLRPFTPEVHRQRSRSDSRSSGTKDHRSRTSLDNKEEDQNMESSSNQEPVDEEKPENVSAGSCDIEIIEEKTNVIVKEDGVMEMLYEVLQNILTDVVLVVSEEDAVDTEPEESDSANDDRSPNPSSANNETHNTDPDLNPHTPAKLTVRNKKPQSLVYLNDLCERTRMRIMVYTLDEVLQDTELDCCSRLRQVSDKHGFSRISSIVQEYSAA